MGFRGSGETGFRRSGAARYSRAMFQIAIANDKGGVGKTTSAIAIASLLASRGRTLLVDADEKTASAVEWAAAGPGLPCEVIRIEEMGDLDLSGFAYVVLDTKAGEDSAELLSLAQAVDLLVVPTKPDGVSMRALPKTLAPLIREGVTNYRVLITDVPASPSVEGHDAREALIDLDVPVFAQSIRRASAFSKAALQGIEVRSVKGDSRAKLAHRDYELVVKEILR